LRARNTLVQLLALYTNPKSHSAQRHGQTDRQTDRWATGWCQSHCAAVRSAEMPKNCHRQASAGSEQFNYTVSTWKKRPNFVKRPEKNSVAVFYSVTVSRHKLIATGNGIIFETRKQCRLVAPSSESHWYLRKKTW